MSNILKKKKKLTKQQKEIEYFIKWLKRFFASTEKEKNLILIKLAGTDQSVYTFVN